MNLSEIRKKLNQTTRDLGNRITVDNKDFFSPGYGIGDFLTDSVDFSTFGAACGFALPQAGLIYILHDIPDSLPHKILGFVAINILPLGVPLIISAGSGLAGHIVGEGIDELLKYMKKK